MEFRVITPLCFLNNEHKTQHQETREVFFRFFSIKKGPWRAGNNKQMGGWAAPPPPRTHLLFGYVRKEFVVLQSIN